MDVLVHIRNVHCCSNNWKQSKGPLVGEWINNLWHKHDNALPHRIKNIPHGEALKTFCGVKEARQEGPRVVGFHLWEISNHRQIRNKDRNKISCCQTVSTGEWTVTNKG